MKEVNGTINETNTPEAFRTVVERVVKNLETASSEVLINVDRFEVPRFS
jgi:hypothetical protein